MSSWPDTPVRVGDRTNRGRSGCCGLLAPSVDVVVEVSVEDTVADLEEAMGAGLGSIASVVS